MLTTKCAKELFAKIAESFDLGIKLNCFALLVPSFRALWLIINLLSKWHWYRNKKVA